MSSMIFPSASCCSYYSFPSALGLLLLKALTQWQSLMPACMSFFSRLSSLRGFRSDLLQLNTDLTSLVHIEFDSKVPSKPSREFAKLTFPSEWDEGYKSTLLLTTAEWLPSRVRCLLGLWTLFLRQEIRLGNVLTPSFLTELILDFWTGFLTIQS